jgi:17beta-estradiol 17-dehydrogenase / 3beta-hydroxysteroid 3-dehydrogenase
MYTTSRWKDRVALVTGASSGIGQALARELAAAGLKVAVCARRKERLDALAEELTASGAEVLAIEANLRDEASILEMFQVIRERWGGVDVLINNAGLGRLSPLVNAPTDWWREMLEVNVLALSICTREAVQDMRRRGDQGHVIHISSLSAYRIPAGNGGGMYGATKHAVRALTEGLRLELRGLESNIRVSAISPGFVETEFAQIYHRSEEAARNLYASLDALQPTDIAEAVRYVLEAPAHVQIHDILLRPTAQQN